MAILGLQPRDKPAMLGDKAIKFFSQNLHDKTVQFPAEEKALFLSTNMAAVTSVANQQWGHIDSLDCNKGSPIKSTVLNHFSSKVF